jgi:hypothetical protein
MNRPEHAFAGGMELQCAERAIHGDVVAEALHAR